MVAGFRERFPGVPIEQYTAEASEFFDRTFDGALALKNEEGLCGSSRSEQSEEGGSEKRTADVQTSGN